METTLEAGKPLSWKRKSELSKVFGVYGAGGGRCRADSWTEEWEMKLDMYGPLVS